MGDAIYDEKIVYFQQSQPTKPPTFPLYFYLTLLFFHFQCLIVIATKQNRTLHSLLYKFAQTDMHGKHWRMYI